MSNFEDHCKHTLERYGIEGREIHQWLDEPSRKYASGHRQFRHDSETVKLVGEIFGKKFGQQLAENIALDHIMADHKEEIQSREEQRQIERRYEPTPEEKKLLEESLKIETEIYYLNQNIPMKMLSDLQFILVFIFFYIPLSFISFYLSVIFFCFFHYFLVRVSMVCMGTT